MFGNEEARMDELHNCDPLHGSLRAPARACERAITATKFGSMHIALKPVASMRPLKLAIRKMRTASLPIFENGIDLRNSGWQMVASELFASQRCRRITLSGAAQLVDAKTVGHFESERGFS